MNPDTLTLFDRMNGDKILPEVVNRLHEKVLKDPLLNPLFEKLEPEAQIEHQRIFVSYAMGSCHNRPGRTLRQMHAKVTIDDQQFDAFLNHLISIFNELDVPEHLIEESKKNVESTRREVLNKSRF